MNRLTKTLTNNMRIQISHGRNGVCVKHMQKNFAIRLIRSWTKFKTTAQRYLEQKCTFNCFFLLVPESIDLSANDMMALIEIIALESCAITSLPDSVLTKKKEILKFYEYIFHFDAIVKILKHINRPIVTLGYLLLALNLFPRPDIPQYVIMTYIAGQSIGYEKFATELLNDRQDNYIYTMQEVVDVMDRLGL